MKKNAKFRQIAAISGVVLLSGMYIAALICAIIKSPAALIVLKTALCGTFFIPVLVYVILMFYKITHKNDETDEPVYSEGKDESNNE